MMLRHAGRTLRSAFAVVLTAVLLAGAGCAARLPVATDDASITARVRTVLMNDPEVSATQISVATSGGVVTISGSVDSPAEADRAVQLARSVEGVREVQSSLQVAPRQ